MEVIVIKPNCFCTGVNNALRMAYKAKSEHPDENIYILGSIVHNEKVISALKEDGFILLDEKEKSLEEWLMSLKKGDVVVFSAHGHDPKLDFLAKNNELIVYDSTCPFVKANELLIKKEVESGGEVIYIGKKGHAEALGALGTGKDKIFLYDPTKEFDYKNSKTKVPLIISQTTMGMDEIKSASEKLLSALPDSRFAARVCDATEKRQKAILTAPKDLDLYVIIGSATSNNTMKLYEIAKKAYPNAQVIRILDLDELKKVKIKAWKKVALASGASTSEVEFDEILTYIKNITIVN